MRRTSRPLARSLAPLVLAATLLAGCSDTTDGSQPDPSATGSSGPSGSSDPEDGAGGSTDAGEASRDTFADVEPATQEVPLGPVQGIESIRFWEGTRLDDGPSQVYGTLASPEGELNVVVSSRDGLMAAPSSEEAAQDWARENSFMDRPGKLADPVVVDGVEVQRVVGSNSFAAIECFVHAAGDVNLFVMFVLPDDLPAQEREQRIGEVMATVDLA